ncbi:hypothetical protein, partial [Mangrovicoccus sp. HB161399]|uniref:hypothetical protein n=1 Tax=Mangrovicoccus sp. HB161399 TaxID=2720392 RepID=UPI001C12FBD3
QGSSPRRPHGRDGRVRSLKIDTGDNNLENHRMLHLRNKAVSRLKKNIFHQKNSISVFLSPACVPNESPPIKSLISTK